MFSVHSSVMGEFRSTCILFVNSTKRRKFHKKNIRSLAAAAMIISSFISFRFPNYHSIISYVTIEFAHRTIKP